MGNSLFFSNGQQPSLQQVLAAREQRAKLEEKLCIKFPDSVLVALKCNIPGPIKNNAAIRRLFEIGVEELQNRIQKQGWTQSFEKTIMLPTGPEYFVVLEALPMLVKQETIDLETESSIGRLWDMDVLHYCNGNIHTINRTQAGFSQRQCFVCSKPAKECGRNRTHTIEEMVMKIEELMIKDGRVGQS